ncbi:hypothetical protein BKA93DRAFT_756513 [Sparassis latifolia]
MMHSKEGTVSSLIDRIILRKISTLGFFFGTRVFLLGAYVVLDFRHFLFGPRIFLLRAGVFRDFLLVGRQLNNFCRYAPMFVLGVGIRFLPFVILCLVTLCIEDGPPIFVQLVSITLLLFRVRQNDWFFLAPNILSPLLAFSFATRSELRKGIFHNVFSLVLGRRLAISVFALFRGATLRFLFPESTP